MKLVSKKLNLANRMDQITYLQPKVLVTVSFLKNISGFSFSFNNLSKIRTR